MKRSFFILFLFSLFTMLANIVYDSFEEILEIYSQKIRKSYIVKIEGPFKRTGIYEFSKKEVSLADILKKVKGFTSSGNNLGDGKTKSKKKKSLPMSKIFFDLKNVDVLDLNDLKMGG